MREIADYRHLVACGLQALDRAQWIGAGIQIDNRQHRRVALDFRDERVGRPAEFQIDSSVARGLHDFGLEEEIVNEYDYVGHASLPDTAYILPQRSSAARFRNVADSALEHNALA